MTAYACGSGGVMFVPEKIERRMPKVVVRRSNDNSDGCDVDDAAEKKESAQE